ncbi:MAG: hypothetical protein U5K81_10915 [Trueperaceae bacterium]|nr:hypothetical protein [Trueperaceae bacterium]
MSDPHVRNADAPAADAAGAAPPSTGAASVAPPVRLSGLPQVARLAHFARHDGPAVLLTTDERRDRFGDAGLFGVACSVDPDVDEWTTRADKVILSLPHALRPFPRRPEQYRLSFALGSAYPRDQLLDTLASYGYPRDDAPGVQVQGDGVSVLLSDDPDGPRLRLGFFGDDLDEIRVDGREAEAYVLSPRRDAPLFDEEGAWEARVLEALPGTVFLDVPELYAGSASEADAAWLWQHLGGREVVSFGRDPLELPTGDPHYDHASVLPGPLERVRGRRLGLAPGRLRRHLGLALRADGTLPVRAGAGSVGGALGQPGVGPRRHADAGARRPARGGLPQ